MLPSNGNFLSEICPLSLELDLVPFQAFLSETGAITIQKRKFKHSRVSQSWPLTSPYFLL